MPDDNVTPVNDPVMTVGVIQPPIKLTANGGDGDKNKVAAADDKKSKVTAGGAAAEKSVMVGGSDKLKVTGSGDRSRAGEHGRSKVKLGGSGDSAKLTANILKQPGRPSNILFLLNYYLYYLFRYIK